MKIANKKVTAERLVRDALEKAKHFADYNIFTLLNEEGALKKAKEYLNVMAFSKDGLIAQLKFDKFTNSQATYGANNCGANWNEQAAKKAREYLNVMAFSRDGLIAQLEFDKFTNEQAVYGAEANGL